MNFLKRYLGIIKSTYFLTTGVILFAALFFAPTIPRFERTGDNYFTVTLNGTEVGSCRDAGRVEDLIARARREISAKRGGMTYILAETETAGQELLFGYVDSEKQLYDRIREVLEESIQETLRHAYTVKINQYMVNLGSSSEVHALLQTALDRYDTEGEYTADVVVDPDRELNVLTTVVRRKDSVDERTGTAGKGAGAEAFLDEIYSLVEPDLEASDFESLDYGLVELDFGDTVEIVDAYLLESEITPLETAISEVTADQQTEQIYEVQPGDTLSQIAEDNGLTAAELVAINPSLENEDSMIRAGDELIITVPEPELSVVHKERIYTEDSYDAETVYIDNDQWYTSESVVRQQPSAGFRKAASLVTYRNDQIESQEIVKEEVVAEALPRIVERGTKVPPTFIKPISGGRLSSGYGGRKAPTKGASTNHQGIDWATPTGTAVMASSGGTVTRAGWGSGYGYVVYIQHEGGRETRYGHLSKVLVSVGQKVSQGQKIALSGNTGRSTGPHLHFELRINGSSVNPLSYLN
ncbi:MAG: M23 family metallopeptidase [Eubacteriales bacterium]|nr:M23 family metallopeptidase [Eubacteriales bacterium]